jgi:site-specific DNA-methyltransferase (adenine-specific)
MRRDLRSTIFHQPYEAHDPNYVEKAYRHSDEKGVYRLLPLLNPNDNRPNLTYEFLGVTRVWRWTKERMRQAYEDGLVVQLKPGAVPQYKKYLEDSLGRTVTNCWTDIPQSAGNESLGYPTQKPVALLERIIAASSNEGDLVLDPFCGCGTTVHAAQKLNRQWIGIDITHLAIALIERRLREAFPGLSFEVHGVPTDHAGARDLANRDKYEFQKWITATIGAQPYKGGKKGMDRGIDGYLNFRDASNKPQFGIISVKGGGVKSGDVRDLKGTMERENAALGIFLTLNKPTREMEKEAAAAGIYETGGMKFPRLQILTAEEVLDNRRPQVPFGFTEGFKKAAREESKQDRLL